MMFAQVLTKWQPSVYGHATILFEFERLLEALGQPWIKSGSILVRSPEESREIALSNSGTTGFHQDAHEGFYPAYVIVWRSHGSVEAVDTDERQFKTLFSGDDGDVVKIDNIHAKHRMPWFVLDPRYAGWSARVWQ